MPCGFPALGVGPLSPARLSHRNIALNSTGLALTGEIDDFILYGLDDFDFTVKVNVLLSRVTFNFHWHKVHFVTNYKMDMNAGNRINVGRNGGGKFAIEDLKIVGLARYNIIGKLRLREFKISATIGDVNSAIENLSKLKITYIKMYLELYKRSIRKLNTKIMFKQFIYSPFALPHEKTIVFYPALLY